MFFTTEFAVFNVVAAGFLMVSIQLWGSHAVVISTGNHRARSNVRKRVWQTYRAAHTVKYSVFWASAIAEVRQVKEHAVSFSDPCRYFAMSGWFLEM